METDKGTPQGGVLSPILSNIYLHYVLDLWFARRLKKQLKGYAKEIHYADDVIICLQYQTDAQRVVEELKGRLSKFGLSLSEEKTRIIEFGRYAQAKARERGKKPDTFDFLGLTHFCDRTRRGKFKVGRRTSRRRFRAKMKAMNGWLKSVRNYLRLRDWWKILVVKLVGHYRYYGVSGNYESIRRFYFRTLNLVFKWINRRSQKKSYTRAGFRQYLECYPLPKPKIYRNLYTLSPSK